MGHEVLLYIASPPFAVCGLREMRRAFITLSGTSRLPHSFTLIFRQHHRMRRDFACSPDERRRVVLG